MFNLSVLCSWYCSVIVLHCACWCWFSFFQHCSYYHREGDRAVINNGEWEAERIPDKGMCWLLVQIKRKIPVLFRFKYWVWGQRQIYSIATSWPLSYVRDCCCHLILLWWSIFKTVHSTCNQHVTYSTFLWCWVLNSNFYPGQRSF